MRLILAIVLFALLLGCATSVPQSRQPDAAFSPADAPDSHPVQMYHYAAQLFEAGEKEEAGFWFYAGQLRYRIHLEARPNLPASGDPALMASLNEVLGREVNEYLGGDPSEWEQAIERALEWDANTPNEYTPKEDFPEAHARVRAGLEALLAQIRESHDEIRRQREQNGLENR